MIARSSSFAPKRRRESLGRWLLASICLALLVGCGGGDTRRPAPEPGRWVEQGPPVTGAAKDVLFTALALVGTPYRYGGNTPEGGFDCSGLVGYVYAQGAGLRLPRTTAEIARLRGHEVARHRLRSGDLVLFGDRRVDHVGIYVGEGRFVHAPSSGGTVRLDHLDGHYWRDRWIGGKRLW